MTFKMKQFLLICAVIIAGLFIRPIAVYAEPIGDEFVDPGGNPGGNPTENPGENPDGDGAGDGTSDAEDENPMIVGPMLDVIFGNNGKITDEDGTASMLNPMGIMNQTYEWVIDAMEGETMQKVYLVFQALGIAILTFHFIYSLATKDMSQEIGKTTVEMLIKPFTKYIICMLILVNIWNLIQFFFLLSQWAFLSINDAVTNGTEIGGDLASMKKTIMTAAGYKYNAGTVDTFTINLPICLGLTMEFLIPYIITIVSRLAMLWTVLSRMVNLVTSGVTAPLAMADIYSDQPLKDTRGFSYLRDFAGLCFQSSVIAIALVITNILSQTFLESTGVTDLGAMMNVAEVSNFAVYLSVLKLVQVGCVIGSASRAKKIFGT